MAKFPLSFSISTLSLWLLLTLTNLQPYLTRSKPTAGCFSMRLISSDSPESPLYIANLTQTEMIERKMRTTIAQVEKHRANMLQITRNYSSSLFPGKWRWPLYRHDFYYSVDLEIGSENSLQHLLVDTGSGTIWTQCDPCTRCFQQTDPIYSRSSSTFKPLDCSHPLCQGNPFSCMNGFCTYKITYGTGNAIIQGFAAFETLQIHSDPPHILPFPKMIFGCSDNNQATFDNGHMISGILGMDLGPSSFVTQIGQRFLGNSFSYCIPPYQQAAAPTYFLRFGSDIPTPPPVAQKLPVVNPYPNNVHYYLPLVDISVGSRRLNLPQGTFDIRQTFYGGCFIDSGVPFSVFDDSGPNPYGAITDAFHEYYNSRKLVRMSYQPQAWDLCYYYPPGYYTDFLSMTYHFKGVDYMVKAEYMHYFDEPRHFFCVVLAHQNGFNILGAYQQQNMRLIYDVPGRAIKFNWEDCNRDHKN